MKSPYTPHLEVYVLAVLISELLFGLVLTVVFATSEGFSMLASAVGAGYFVALYGTVLAVPGVLVVHLLCRRVRQQAVHVLAAGVAGVAAGSTYFGPWAADVPWLVLSVGASTAAGRAAVIPLVRRRAAAVDRDFVPTPGR